ncbi:ABC transporter permease [Virgibacillus sp. DJP39]|uniref:ABC transporter permease n=1 Tax=Virgibacillus sp. DJP39 TaxID=3409790 RepID=UPI003BB53F0C
MLFFHHVFLFIKSNLKQLQRKWPSLPLLFLFPIIIVGLSAYILTSFFIPDEGEAIHVGLITHDQSKETAMIVELIEQSSQLSSFIEIENMSSSKAKQALTNNQLSAYIVLPDNFTNSLYNGSSVTLKIIGNPDKRVESYLVKELIDSVTRHIKTAQANILTINYYAKQLEMDDGVRNDFIFQQFTDFVFYTLGKDKIIDEELLKNNVTTSPVQYYGLGALFIILTIWLLAFYSTLTRTEESGLKKRMKLFNVTEMQQLLAKIVVSWIISIIFTIFIFYGFIRLFDISLYFNDYVKVYLFLLIYSFLFLIGLAIIEVSVTGPKIRLFIHSFYTVTLLLLSGAIIPTIYYPMYLQELLPYSFSYQAFKWLLELLLNNGIYVDYIPLIIYLIIGSLLLFGISSWKERISL